MKNEKIGRFPDPLCLDARMLVPGGTGVSTYARALHHIQATIQGRSLTLAADPIRTMLWRRFAAAARPGAQVLKICDDVEGQRFVSRELFKRAHLHFRLYGRLLSVVPPIRFGLMHWTYPVPLHMAGWINVYTVHDVIPLTHPELSTISPRRLRNVLATIAQKADRIVTVSAAATAAIRSTRIFDGVPINDCGQMFAPDTGPVPPPRTFPANGYLLYYGTVEPRKNVERLLAAYRRSRVALPLLIVGPDGMQAERINDAVARTKGAIRISFQQADDLRSLVRHARALIFPTLAEGFGLPILEAMAAGVPVLTSNIPATTEVAGGAALLVDPTNEYAIAAAICRLVTDDVLCSTLLTAGLVRARAFTEARFRQRIEGCYRSAFAEHQTVG